jgi:polysaccharide export outer membrane protein
MKHCWILLLVLFSVLVSCQSDKPELVNPVYDDGGFGDATPVFKPAMGKILPGYFERAYRGEHKIKAGDFLEISVIDHGDTRIEKLPVSPDGFVYYLMSKPVYAVGLNTNQLKEKLETGLADFFADPIVFVRVQKSNKNSFQILGKVKFPGEYELGLPLKLSEALALAGGLQSGLYRLDRISLANLKNSYLIRNKEKLPIDFKTLIEKGNEKNNIYMRPGDYIYIASAVSQEVYILGEAQRAQAVYYKENMTVLQLLTQASYTKDAYLAGAIILRKSLTKPQVIQIDINKVLYGKAKDIYLEPGDILFIPQNPYKFVKEVVELALRAFVQSFASDAGLFYSDERIFTDD